jgi:hypothetical protein
MVTLLKEESLGELTWKVIPFNVSVLLNSACSAVAGKSSSVESKRGLIYDMVDPFYNYYSKIGEFVHIIYGSEKSQDDKLPKLQVLFAPYCIWKLNL